MVIFDTRMIFLPKPKCFIRGLFLKVFFLTWRFIAFSFNKTWAKLIVYVAAADGLRHIRETAGAKDIFVTVLDIVDLLLNSALK